MVPDKRRRSVGVWRGRSKRANDPSLRDQIVEREDPETQIETKPETPVEQKPVTDKPKKRKKRRNDRRPIDYFGALDNIIADIYEKNRDTYKIVTAVTQMMEQRGHPTPFEEERFLRSCRYLAEIEATKEVAWLFGLGPEHADHVARLMTEKFFGIVPKKG